MITDPDDRPIHVTLEKLKKMESNEAKIARIDERQVGLEKRFEERMDNIEGKIDVVLTNMSQYHDEQIVHRKDLNGCIDGLEAHAEAHGLLEKHVKWSVGIVLTIFGLIIALMEVM